MPLQSDCPREAQPTCQSGGEELPRRLLRQLVRTFGLVRALMQDHFEQFGLTGPQFGVLMTLHEIGQRGIAQAELSRHLLVSGPNVTVLVDRLERAGLVQRVRSDEDRRKNLLRLSANGERVLEQVLRVHGPRAAELMSGIGTDQQSLLSRLLETMGNDLEEKLDEARRHKDAA